MAQLQDYLNNPPALVGPDYNIYRYCDGLYKVIHFKQPRSLVPIVKPPKNKDPGDKKPESSLSRARRIVLEYALCNDWKYFCTFTLDKEKYDRFNLEVFKKDFTQWIRDQRKKYKKLGLDLDAKFLLVPELHNDGAWHIHGLFGDITPLTIPFYYERMQGMKIPDKLFNNGYFDWPEYRKKFGFCSLGLIKDKVRCGFYVSKYITETLQSSCDSLGVHSYIPSRGLNRASLHGSVYGDCAILDSVLVNRYEFVETGMTTFHSDIDWDWAMVPFMDKSGIHPIDIFDYNNLPEPDQHYFDTFYEGVQEVLEGFL